MNSCAHRSCLKKGLRPAVFDVTKYVCPFAVATSLFGLTHSPQGLKPQSVLLRSGAAEAAPFQALTVPLTTSSLAPIHLIFALKGRGFSPAARPLHRTRL